MLLSVMLLVTLMLIGLSVELPRIGQQIKRAKEEELIHRGNEYKNAIRKYFRKFGQYPVSIDQLVNTNNQRFLRKRYKDPFTGKDDWRILHPGEVQVNPITGGTVSVSQGQAGSINPAGTVGQPGTFGQSAGFGGSTVMTGQSPGFGASTPVAGQSPGFGMTSPTASPTPTTQSGTDQSGAGTTPGSTGGITPASGMPGASSPLIGGGPMVGVSSISKSKSIKVIKGKDHYNDWQFVYDPRLDVQNAAGIGANMNTTSPIGGTGAPGFGPQPGNNPMNNPSTPGSPGMPSTNPNPQPTPVTNPPGPNQ